MITNGNRTEIEKEIADCIFENGSFQTYGDEEHSFAVYTPNAEFSKNFREPAHITIVNSTKIKKFTAGLEEDEKTVKAVIHAIRYPREYAEGEHYEDVKRVNLKNQYDVDIRNLYEYATKTRFRVALLRTRDGDTEYNGRIYILPFKTKLDFKGKKTNSMNVEIQFEDKNGVWADPNDEYFNTHIKEFRKDKMRVSIFERNNTGRKKEPEKKVCYLPLTEYFSPVSGKIKEEEKDRLDVLMNDGFLVHGYVNVRDTIRFDRLPSVEDKHLTFAGQYCLDIDVDYGNNDDIRDMNKIYYRASDIVLKRRGMDIKNSNVYKSYNDHIFKSNIDERLIERYFE